MWEAVTFFIGALRALKALSAINEEMSEAILHLGVLSSTITTLPVSSADSNIDSSSSGEVVLGSITVPVSYTHLTLPTKA